LLKLRARDAEDLQVIAAHLQDAIVPVSEMLYLPQPQRFILVANRFRWEEAGETGPAAPAGNDAAFAEGRPTHFERIHCGLWFEKVRAVRYRGLDRRARGTMLELLTIKTDAGGSVGLVFAGGGDVQLEVSELDCFMEDLGEAWPTQWRPQHAPADQAGG